MEGAAPAARGSPFARHMRTRKGDGWAAARQGPPSRSLTQGAATRPRHPPYNPPDHEAVLGRALARQRDLQTRDPAYACVPVRSPPVRGGTRTRAARTYRLGGVADKDRPELIQRYSAREPLAELEHVLLAVARSVEALGALHKRSSGLCGCGPVCDRGAHPGRSYARRLVGGRSLALAMRAAARLRPLHLA